MKTALVTGGTGFIGSHLVELLLTKGYHVRCMVRQSSSLQWLKGLEVEYLYGDLFTPEALRKGVEDVQYVYHCAGVTAAKDSAGYFRGNQEGTRNILEACTSAAGALKKFIYISSQTAIGPGIGNDPMTESTPPHPITSYGESKLAAEQEVNSRMSWLPAVIARPPAVYGPRDVGILTFFQTIGKGLEPLIGFDEKRVSLVHSSDLVRGIVMAGEAEKAVGTSYNIGSKRPYNWLELGSLARRVMDKKTVRIRIPHALVMTIAGISGTIGNLGKKPPIFNYEKGKDLVQANWTMSSEKAKAELGYEEQLTVEDGFKCTIDWYKARGWI